MEPQFSPGQTITFPEVGKITFVENKDKYHVFKTEHGDKFIILRGELCPNCEYRMDCRYPADKANCIFKVKV
jgi:RPA family protein